MAPSGLEVWGRFIAISFRNLSGVIGSLLPEIH